MASKASDNTEPERTRGFINSSFQNSQQGSGETEPKKKSVRGGYTCCVPGCYSNTKRDQELSFHKFPKDESMKLKWSNAIKRKDFVLRELVEGKLLVSLRVRVAARYTTSIASSHRLLSWLRLAAALL